MLAQHLRNCPAGKDDQQGLRLQKQQRTKRACDQCARSKSKCDSQIPCNRCRHRKFTCSYMRHGPQDMYAAYLVKSEEPSTLSSGCTSSIALDLLTNAVGDTWSSSPSFVSLPPAPSPSSLGYLQPLPAMMGMTSPKNKIDVCCEEITTDNTEALFTSMDLSSFDSYLQDLLLPCYQYDMNILSAKTPISHIIECTPTVQNSLWVGFSENQTDPVEARCREIRDMLNEPKFSITTEEATSFISRSNLIHYCNLFGRHFLCHYPILHCPSFRLTECSPLLLLAMSIVGSCYSDLTTPPKLLVKLAVGLLKALKLSSVGSCCQ